MSKAVKGDSEGTQQLRQNGSKDPYSLVTHVLSRHRQTSCAEQSMVKFGVMSKALKAVVIEAGGVR